MANVCVCVKVQAPGRGAIVVRVPKDAFVSDLIREALNIEGLSDVPPGIVKVNDGSVEALMPVKDLVAAGMGDRDTVVLLKIPDGE